MNTYLVTGVAGFIGCYLTQKLLKEGNTVIGVDNLNDYYDVTLKNERLNLIEKNINFIFYKYDISDKEAMESLFNKYRFDYVINLAAQAGVRYSIENPDVYIKSNVIGFYNILELVRIYKPKHLIYASSSSVYGASQKTPFLESDFVDNPVSLYAATKKTNELMAYTYSHLYDIPSTGLRFFTVYGPMGRPDMAYFDFTNKLFNNEPIKIFNNGDFNNDLYRDFTYIDDIIEAIIKIVNKPPMNLQPKYRILNIGNSQPVKLMDFITILEEELSLVLGKKVVFIKIFEPIKKGDVRKTFASTKKLNELIDFTPNTSIREGLRKFCEWYVQRRNKDLL